MQTRAPSAPVCGATPSCGRRRPPPLPLPPRRSPPHRGGRRGARCPPDKPAAALCSLHRCARRAAISVDAGSRASLNLIAPPPSLSVPMPRCPECTRSRGLLHTQDKRPTISTRHGMAWHKHNRKKLSDVVALSWQNPPCFTPAARVGRGAPGPAPAVRPPRAVRLHAQAPWPRRLRHLCRQELALPRRAAARGGGQTRFPRPLGRRAGPLIASLTQAPQVLALPSRGPSPGTPPGVKPPLQPHSAAAPQVRQQVSRINRGRPRASRRGQPCGGNGAAAAQGPEQRPGQG
jgi:hypothetical protein